MLGPCTAGSAGKCAWNNSPLNTKLKPPWIRIKTHADLFICILSACMKTKNAYYPGGETLRFETHA